MQDVSGVCPLLCDSLLRLSCLTVGQLLVSSFSSVFVQFRHSSVYCDSYSQSSAVVPLSHSASKRKQPKPYFDDFQGQSHAFQDNHILRKTIHKSSVELMRSIIIGVEMLVCASFLHVLFLEVDTSFQDSMLLYKVHFRSFLCQFIPFSFCVIWILCTVPTLFPNLDQCT